MAPWQSGYVQANGIRLHYTRTGGAKPPVVLAHGFSDDGLCWTPVARQLEAEYDVIMFDARGHGRSDDPEEGYGTDVLAEDLAAALRALGLRRPPILGHSMGAATALALAGAHPDLPGAILLEDPPASWVETARPLAGSDEWRARTRAWVVAFKRKTREELIAYQRAQEPTWSEDELGPWADSKLRLSFNVLNRAAPTEQDWRATVRRITCPALLITGDTERGALVSPEAAADFQSLVPGARVEHIPGAGHSIRRDQFGRYMEVVRDFLASVRSAGQE